MTDERRCEECLELPGSDGTCSRHPYARLIWISPEEAREEQALLRGFRRSRLKAGAAIFGAIFLVFSFIGLIGGPGTFTFVLFLTFSFLGALHLPAALMWAHGSRLRTGEPGIPLWLRTVLAALAGVLLSVLFVVSAELADLLRGREMLLLSGPATVWLLCAASMVRGARASRQRIRAAVTGALGQDAAAAPARARRKAQAERR